MKRFISGFIILLIFSINCYSQNNGNLKRDYADVTGDGILDHIVYVDHGENIVDILIYRGIGNNYSAVPITISHVDRGYPDKPWGFADVNGDGKADFITIRGVPSRFEKVIYLSTGEGLDLVNRIITNYDGSISFSLFMRELCCDKTTEQGADEVYIIISGKKSDGAVYDNREPGNSRHWDMNDGSQPTNNPNGDSHCITDRVLFTGDLKDGQTWWLNVIVGEEDGGTSSTPSPTA